MKNLLVALMAVIGICYTTSSLAQEQVQEKTGEPNIILDDKNNEGETTIEIKDGKLYVDGNKMADLDKNMSLKIIKKNTMSTDGNSYFKQFDMPFEFPLNRSFRNGPSQKVLLGVITENANPGARINKVLPKSAAEDSGLKVGDIITTINGKDIVNYEDLAATISNYKDGETIHVDVIRDDMLKKMVVTLKQSASDEMDRTTFGDLFPQLKLEDFWTGSNVFDTDKQGNTPRLGMEIEEDNNELIIINVEANSAADKAGIKKNDKIKRIDGTDILTLSNLKQTIAAKKSNKSIQIAVIRAGAVKNLSVEIPQTKKRAQF